MATELFYKLKEDKKKAILDAAKHEFEVFPYSDASINRIIKVAGISRGSFYLYFSDKNDLLMTLIQETLIIPFQQDMEQQRFHNMNAFDYTVVCFDILCQHITNEYSLFRQFFTFGILQQFDALFSELWPKGFLSQSGLKHDQLRFHSIVEKRMLEETLQFVLFSHIKQYLTEEENISKIRTLLLKHLLTLKIGFQK